MKIMKKEFKNRTTSLLSTTVFFLLVIFSSPSNAFGFPVLFGDEYQVMIQFEGESSQSFNSISDWGVGQVFDGGNFTGTPFEQFWPSGSQAGNVTWRTFSSQLAGGFGTLNVPNSLASIRAQVCHSSATFVNISVTGLDGWVDFPSLTSITGAAINPASIETHAAKGGLLVNLTNILVGASSLSFRVPIGTCTFSGTTEFNIGFRGRTAPQYSCAGFKAPFDQSLALRRKTNRVIPLKISLTDANGLVVSNTSIAAPPVVNVLFNGTLFGTVPPDDSELLPPGAANEENMFRFDAASNHWIYNLGTKQFGAAGTYEVSVEPGDNSEYGFANGACTQTFERLP